jgi:hypothetical protein
MLLVTHLAALIIKPFQLDSAFAGGADAIIPFEKPVDHLRAKPTWMKKPNRPEAFGELYEKSIERIYNYVYFRVGHRARREDLTPGYI